MMSSTVLASLMEQAQRVIATLDKIAVKLADEGSNTQSKMPLLNPQDFEGNLAKPIVSCRPTRLSTDSRRNYDAKESQFASLSQKNDTTLGAHQMFDINPDPNSPLNVVPGVENDLDGTQTREICWKNEVNEEVKLLYAPNVFAEIPLPDFIVEMGKAVKFEEDKEVISAQVYYKFRTNFEEDDALDFGAYNLFDEMSEQVLSFCHDKVPTIEENNTYYIDENTLRQESSETFSCENGVYSCSICKQREIKVVLIATGVNSLLGKTAHLADITQAAGHFQQVLTSIENFCICSIAVVLWSDFLYNQPSTSSLLNFIFDPGGERIKMVPENFDGTFTCECHVIMEAQIKVFDPGLIVMDIVSLRPTQVRNKCMVMSYDLGGIGLDVGHNLKEERLINEGCTRESVDLFRFDPGGMWEYDLWDDDDGLLHEVSLLSDSSYFRLVVYVLAFLAGNGVSHMSVKVFIFIPTLEDKGDLTREEMRLVQLSYIQWDYEMIALWYSPVKIKDEFNGEENYSGNQAPPSLDILMNLQAGFIYRIFRSDQCTSFFCCSWLCFMECRSAELFYKNWTEKYSVLMEQPERRNEEEQVIDIRRSVQVASFSYVHYRSSNELDLSRSYKRPSSTATNGNYQLSPPDFNISNSRNSQSSRSNAHSRWRRIIAVPVIVLSLSGNEHPNTPLFAWIVGYAYGCVATLPLLYWRYLHRNPEEDVVRSRQSSSHGNLTTGLSFPNTAQTREDDNGTVDSSNKVATGIALIHNDINFVVPNINWFPLFSVFLEQKEADKLEHNFTKWEFYMGDYGSGPMVTEQTDDFQTFVFDPGGQFTGLVIDVMVTNPRLELCYVVSRLKYHLSLILEDKDHFKRSVMIQSEIFVRASLVNLPFISYSPRHLGLYKLY